MKRFYDKIKKDQNGCWLWIAAKHIQGYGLFGFEGKTTNAHRVMWILKNGPIPDGLCVLHHCDNPPCVNPDHLFVGTHQDNMTDMKSKGRNAFGERQGNSKLTTDQVKKIKNALANSQTYESIAEEYFVSYWTIGNIARGETWRHVKCGATI